MTLAGTDRQLVERDVEGYLRRYQSKELLRFVAVGSVDDGKSTLIGRLLFDTGSVYQDQLEAARKATQMQGTDIDLSLLTDGLAAEREQGITIDVAYRYFTTDKRKFIIADTPGHVQYTRNMVTGASTANAAVILIDARLGVLQQSRRHAYIASLLGIRHLAVCVNKMDLVDYDRGVFQKIRAELAEFTRSLSFADVTFFPISALEGANCVRRSPKVGWYDGPTVLEYLETVPVRDDGPRSHFRFPVQTVLRPNLDYRGYAGRVASGIVRRGDAVVVLPSGKTSRVKAIDTHDGELAEAFAPQSVTLRLDDEIDVSRGDMLAHTAHPPSMARTFDAHVVWLHETPLDPARTYLLKHTTQIARVEIDRVHWRKDMDTLDEVPTRGLALNDIGLLTVTAHRPLFFDAYEINRETGSFILVDPISNNTVGAGMIAGVSGDASSSRRGGHGGLEPGDGVGEPRGTQVSARERAARAGTSGGIVIVGKPDAGDAEALAYALERRLFDHGVMAAVVLRGEDAGGAASAARAIAGAGLLAIVPAGALPRGALEAGSGGAQGGPATFLTADLTLDAEASLERRAEAVVAALRSRRWLA